MIQTAIKIVTLGFFISLISGFVLYRSGFFDEDDNWYALQKSPNGGELNNVTDEQDSTKIDALEQQKQLQIMPSTKSAPAFDLQRYEQKKNQEILPSTKSMTHPIRINPDAFEVKLENPYIQSSKSKVKVHDFQLAEEVKTPSQTRSSSNVSYEKDSILIEAAEDDHIPESTPKQSFESKDTEENAEDNPKGVSWGLIGLGVLGIVFVGIGSIVYFKKRSK